MNIFEKIMDKLTIRYRENKREILNDNNRSSLKNKDFSIISSNCNGACILHDLGLKFLTPTVNLWFEPKDFIEFISNLEYYLSCEIQFSSELEQKLNYPVGIIDNKIKIYFEHYENNKIAKEKWEERAKRINFDNLFILFTDRDGCTYDDIAKFDRLPYKNKVIFTNKKYDEFSSSFYIKGFENDESVGICSSYKGYFTGEKYYDDFPYVKWFNNES